MKHLNFILTFVIFCLIIITCTIYLKPAPNRYLFETKESHTAPEGGLAISGYIIKDTSTGKIYEWSDMAVFINNKVNQMSSVRILDPVHHKEKTEISSSHPIIKK